MKREELFGVCWLHAPSLTALDNFPRSTLICLMLIYLLGPVTESVNCQVCLFPASWEGPRLYWGPGHPTWTPLSFNISTVPFKLYVVAELIWHLSCTQNKHLKNHFNLVILQLQSIKWSAKTYPKNSYANSIYWSNFFWNHVYRHVPNLKSLFLILLHFLIFSIHHHHTVPWVENPPE